MLDEIEEFLTGVRHRPATSIGSLATVVSVDIVDANGSAAEMGEPRRGENFSSVYDGSWRGSSTGSAAGRSRPRAMAVLATFDGPGTSGGLRPSDSETSRHGARIGCCEPACTSERSTPVATDVGASDDPNRDVRSRPWRNPVRCSSRAPWLTSSWVPGSRPSIAANTCSRARRESGGSSRSRIKRHSTAIGRT